MKEMIKVNIKREKSLVGVAVPYRIMINGKEIGAICNGQEITLEHPCEQFSLNVSSIGNSMNFKHLKIEKEIVITPEKCRSNIINCKIITTVNWIGVIFPLFKRGANIAFEISYM